MVREGSQRGLTVSDVLFSKKKCHLFIVYVRKISPLKDV